MLGIAYSIIAGISMSLQGVFNTRLSDKIGLWQANSFVQGTGFICTLVALLLASNGNLKNIKDVNKLYLLGGILGAIIIFTVMKGIKSLGITYSISIILVSQLLSAGLIDAFGLFNTPAVKFHIYKFIGTTFMILGIIIFKCKG
jgi:bacterial/archaeal transporter family-2 protein